MIKSTITEALNQVNLRTATSVEDYFTDISAAVKGKIARILAKNKIKGGVNVIVRNHIVAAKDEAHHICSCSVRCDGSYHEMHDVVYWPIDNSHVLGSIVSGLKHTLASSNTGFETDITPRGIGEMLNELFAAHKPIISFNRANDGGARVSVEILPVVSLGLVGDNPTDWMRKAINKNATSDDWCSSPSSAQ